MKHKIKKSKTRKKYSKRVSKKVTKRQKKELKRKKKNSRKNKIKKGGDATTTIGLAAAAIGMGTAAMYFRRNIDPTDEDKLGKQYDELLKTATQSSVDSNYAELSKKEKDKIGSEIKVIFGKIKNNNEVAEAEYKRLEELYEKYQQQPWFPLKGDIQSYDVGAAEEKVGEEESFNDRIARAIEKKAIHYQPEPANK